ncbi:MAG: hypothetical protein ETSY1_36890 [Candidatus Entotheonella factor]|uniref:Fe2OG dioxygenase domain-containing protein n=1 Tax=Entotheonella factor TaxID=1429438 RepID=W4L7T6_ENTF1|nr:hypothetical protein [Candidatus Entotheonella palauensis]ETW93969.1 MAG: hypothetical protein ETSY1_36890 [Candidatus Entotheonella factor]
MEAMPDDLICLDRYPVNAPRSPEFQRLCEWAQAELDQRSVVVLPDFLQPHALQRMRQEALELFPLAHHMDGVATLYPEHKEDTTLPLDHIRRRRFHTSLHAIAYSLIPLDSPLRALYEWDPLMQFVGALLGLDTIYRNEDIFSALNLAVMTDGDEFGWHFDQTDFVVSLALQESDLGGEFNCRHAIRSDHDDNDAGVKSVVEWRDEAIATVPMKAGTFMLFQGRHALHSVKPIQGDTPRIVALLAYDTKPGMVSSAALHKVRFGIESR